MGRTANYNILGASLFVLFSLFTNITLGYNCSSSTFRRTNALSKYQDETGSLVYLTWYRSNTGVARVTTLNTGLSENVACARGAAWLNNHTGTTSLACGRRILALGRLSSRRNASEQRARDTAARDFQFHCRLLTICVRRFLR